jgi:hypothetical protein
MTRTIPLVLLVLAVASIANASYWAECEVIATVSMAGGDMADIEVIQSEAVAGHGPCRIKPGSVYVVPATDLDHQTGRLLLRFEYGNGIGMNGYVESFEWRVAG